MKPLATLLFSLLLLAGCDLFESTDEAATSVVAAVYVANQGNFSDGNGSVSVYDPETGLAAPDAITGLGSIVQSVFARDTTLYVVANTGGRVAVYGAAGRGLRASISGLLAPRYMAAQGTLGFVTNLYGDAATFSGGTISVLDLARNVKLRDVAVGDNPEGIAVAGGRVYVANSGFGNGSTVSVLDAQGMAVIQTLDVACDGPRNLAVDEEDEVWVFCTGRMLYDADFNVIGQTDGAVRVLDGATGRIVARIDTDGPIGAANLGQDAFYSAQAQEAYAILNGEGVLRFDTRTNTLAATLTRSDLGGDATPIGAIAYDAARETLYLGRVPGFTTSGTVRLHGRDGKAKGAFPVGIAPSYITFREEAR